MYRATVSKLVDGKRVKETTVYNTQEEYEAAGFKAHDPSAQDPDSERLSKRPKRSEINALIAKVSQDNSVAELRDTVAALVTMMNNVLAFQQVDVDEDE